MKVVSVTALFSARGPLLSTLVNALPVKLNTGSQVTGNATNQELAVAYSESLEA
jgi:hypothetical protein